MSQKKELDPFSCSFTPQFPELLNKLNCTLLISTFQAGKIAFISPKDDHFLVQLPRNFRKPMGVAIQGNKMAIASYNEIIILKSSEELAKMYPTKPDVYDNIWVPRATYYTGILDIHDLHFGSDDQLWAVNTAFSCLCTIDEENSFTPKWQPHFISDLLPEDRCHLNGLAMDNGNPKYISGLGRGNEYQSWRKDVTKNGIIMDIDSNTFISENLGMPHTPRIYDGKLYCLLSSEQKLVEVDQNNGKVEDVAFLPGFVRGMSRIGDYVFVATSKLRKNSSTFKDLDIPESANAANIYAVHLPTGTVQGKLTYHMSVDEIYDIQILENSVRPNIINTSRDWHHRALMTPNATFWSKAPKSEENDSNKDQNNA